MGVAYSALGKSHDAIKCYRKAILINPFEFLYWKNMADEYYTLEQYAKVIRYGRIAFMINPQMTSTANLLGMGYGMTGKYKEAIVYLKKAIALDSENLDSVHNLEVTYQKIEKEKLRRSGRAGRKASA
jgi:tetratricopeptide (TPR) repeat protein